MHNINLVPPFSQRCAMHVVVVAGAVMGVGDGNSGGGDNGGEVILYVLSLLHQPNAQS